MGFGELPAILSQYNAAEVVDFNGDEGLSLTPIESTGVVLNQDAGNLYAGNSPLYISATTQLTTSFT